MGISADAKLHIETRPRTGGDAYDHGDIKKPGNDATKNQIGFFSSKFSIFSFFDSSKIWSPYYKAGIMNLHGEVLFLSSTLRISHY